MHERDGAVEFGLQEILVGLVGSRVRHLAGGIGDHAVGRNDGVALDTVRPDHGETIAGRGLGAHRGEAAAALMLAL